jgi:hypothetical protein
MDQLQVSCICFLLQAGVEDVSGMIYVEIWREFGRDIWDCG